MSCFVVFQFAQEASVEYEQMGDVMYEGDIVENTIQTDQYQWPDDSDPAYTSPVQTQMAMQAPMRQRQSAPPVRVSKLRDTDTACYVRSNSSVT